MQKELDLAKQLNNQITTTKEQTQNSFKQVSFQNKVQVTEIVDLKKINYNLEQKVKNFKIKDLEEREKIYKEIEEFYERNLQDIANKTSHAAQAIEELKNLTSSNPNQSLQQELNSQETNTEIQKIIDYLIVQTNDQDDLISDKKEIVEQLILKG